MGESKQRRLGRPRWLTIALGAMLCYCLPGSQANSSSSVPASLARGYRLTSWGTAEGLPSIVVISIVQTRDGYLWIGTQEGLVRFDGARFTVFDKGNIPGVRFRYKLEGFDRGWIDAGARRSAYYTNIPPVRARHLTRTSDRWKATLESNSTRPRGESARIRERYLPSSPAIPPAVPPATPSEPEAHGTNRRILQEMLTNWGIRPTAAEGGTAALECVKQAKDRFCRSSGSDPALPTARRGGPGVRA